MDVLAPLSNVIPAQQSMLSQTIGKIRSEFWMLKRELMDARSEIRQLKAILAKERKLYPKLKGVKIDSLRRRVAFYCHPDRGGDAELMTNLNTLFDSLALFEYPTTAEVEKP